MNIHEKIFQKIERLVPKLYEYQVGDAIKLKTNGYMDLNIDILRKTDQKVVVSFAHNWIKNGDVMADPDMEISLIPTMKMAEALTFQQDDPPLYQVVYPEPGKFYPQRKKELNDFLLQWLTNIENQGHRLPDMVDKASDATPEAEPETAKQEASKILCSNSELGWMNGQCGRPASWAGTHKSGHVQHFCDRCKGDGYEAAGVVTWKQLQPA